MGGVNSSRLLSPEYFEDAKRELTMLAELAEQHFERWITGDREFIEQVLRPPVSVRKVRALVRRQNLAAESGAVTPTAPGRALLPHPIGVLPHQLI